MYEDRKHYLVLFYKCKLNGDPMVDGCQWFTFEEVKRLDVLPGTREVIELLEEAK
jgi:hypothetical protein